MHKILFASMLAAGLVLPALAEDAGTIKLHSGWKLIQERVDKGVAYGTLWGGHLQRRWQRPSAHGTCFWDL